MRGEVTSAKDCLVQLVCSQDMKEMLQMAARYPVPFSALSNLREAKAGVVSSRRK